MRCLSLVKSAVLMITFRYVVSMFIISLCFARSWLFTGSSLFLWLESLYTQWSVREYPTLLVVNTLVYSVEQWSVREYPTLLVVNTLVYSVEREGVPHSSCGWNPCTLSGA